MKKNETPVLSIMTNLTSLEHANVLDDIFYVYNQYKFRFFRNTISKKPLSEKEFREVNKQMDRRYGRSIEEDIKGLKDSIQSNRKNYISNKKEKIKNVEKTIKKQEQKLENSLEEPTIFKKDIKNLLKWLPKLERKRERLKSELSQLKYDFDNNLFSICFGSKKLFGKQFKPHVNHDEWKEEWYDSRYNYFRLTGAKDETCGNNNAQLRLISNDKFELKLRIPVCLEEKYGKTITIKDISFNKKQAHLVKYAVLSNMDLNSPNRSPISVKIHKIKGKYRLTLSIRPPKVEIKTTDKYGVCAVDINVDNFAVSNIDQYGKLIETKIFRFNLNNKTSNQREDIIFNTMNKVVEYALERGKHLVYEDLDFKEKRNQLSDSDNKEYNKMLSSFAYSKMLQQLKSSSFRQGVEIKSINPAYTSLIGKVKYQKKHGLSVHEAAAYVIARKYYNFKEKIESTFMFNYKGLTYRFTAPVDEVKDSQSNYNAKYLRVLNKWMKKQMESKSGWTLSIKRPKESVQLS